MFTPQTMTHEIVPSRAELGKNIADHLTVDVGQTEITPGVAVGETLVVESEQVQEGGVQVMNAGRLLDRLETEVIGRSVSDPAANSTPSQPDAEPVMVVVPAKLRFAVAAEFHRWSAADSPPQMISVSSNIPRCLRSDISAAIG